MSNAEMIARWYEEEAAGTADAEWLAFWARHWHPDIEWRAVPGAIDDPGPMHGVDRLVRYYGEWLELFEDVTTVVRSAQDVGEHVVLLLHIQATSRSSGIRLDYEYAIVVDLDDEQRVVRGREFATFEDALSAAEAEVV